jgi:membrane associated rhomboid family serine protease
MSYFRQFRPTKHEQFPPGVKNLIIINGIMFIAKSFADSRGIDMNGKLGIYHPFCDNFQWYQYVTNMFMHGSVMHILFNMIGLWLFGHMLENALGLKRFLIFYLVCGVGASFIYQVWESFAQYRLLSHAAPGAGMIDLLQAFPPCIPAVGASGAVYGLLMGAALLFPNTEVSYFGFMGFPIKIKWLAVIYGGLEIYRGIGMSGGDNVAHFAHIGGMIFGFILVKIYARNRSNFY